MSVFAPEFIAAASSGRWTRLPGGAAPVTGFTIDSRQLAPGQCFVALKTDKRDGHDFLPAAQAAGAAAAIVSTPDPALSLPQLVVADPLAAFQRIAAAHRRAFTGPVVGVSGSAGKTSTKELLALLLSEAPGDVLATEGNLNNHLGVPLTLLRLDPAKHRRAVIEAGIGGPGDMTPLAAMIEPDLAVITLVGPAHLEALGSLDGVAREKAKLPAGARPGARKFFPAACLAYPAFRELAAPAIALEPRVAHGADETRVAFVLDGSEHSFACRRVSDGMASNVALALAAALSLGVSPAAAQARLGGWRPAALRGELRRDERGRWLYVDCYNANPASMHDALSVFAAIAPADQPRLYVIGGMEELGAESVSYHHKFGAALAAALRPGDAAVVLAAPSAAEAVVAGAAHAAVVAVPDLDALRARFEAFAGAVFMKGSRRYRLESVLAPAGAPSAAH